MTNQREREEKGGGRGADARRWDRGVGSLARSSRSQEEEEEQEQEQEETGHWWWEGRMAQIHARLLQTLP